MELFDLTVEELKKGYGYDQKANRFKCAVCGREFENGEIFRDGERFFTAEKMAELHVRSDHGGMLAVLLALDKRLTGLTENQKELLTMMYGGVSDREIAEKTGTAQATIRHQRFVFREKVRQAKLCLAVFELALGGRTEPASAMDDGETLMEIHQGAKMVDDRYLVTIAEEKAIIANAFSSLDPLRLRTLPPKEKKKIVILKRISEEFERGRRYSEKELNAILQTIFEDFASIRRYLIEYGYMDRTQDCREYWRI